jgi:hypothetical protein
VSPLIADHHEYVDGALCTDLYSGASVETLNLFAPVLPLLAQQLGAGPEEAPSPDRGPQSVTKV